MLTFAETEAEQVWATAQVFGIPVEFLTCQDVLAPIPGVCYVCCRPVCHPEDHRDRTGQVSW